MLLRGIRRLPESISVKLSRWRCGGRGLIGKAPFNKRSLLRSCRFFFLALLSLAGHGGLAREWTLATTYGDGGDGGYHNIYELISDAGARSSQAMK
jgi:hypothetical protein